MTPLVILGLVGLACLAWGMGLAIGELIVRRRGR